MTIQEALEKLQGYEKATFALTHATGLCREHRYW